METPRPPKLSPSWINRTVLGASVASAFAEFVHETCNVLFPGLCLAFGVPIFAIALTAGIASALASVAKFLAGYTAHRLDCRKGLATFGYGLAVVSQVVFVIATGWILVACAYLVAVVGRGIRNALRDAILSDAVESPDLGHAFGFHRAAISIGSVCGPLIITVLLASAASRDLVFDDVRFQYILWIMIIPSGLATTSFAYLVVDRRVRLRCGRTLTDALRSLTPNLKTLIAAVTLFGLGDFSHALLVLGAITLLQPRLGLLEATVAAAGLYTWKNAVQMLSSFPVGAFADRWGRRRLLIISYSIGAATAFVMSLAFLRIDDGVALLPLTFGLAGLYVAVKDVAEPALAAECTLLVSRTFVFGIVEAANGAGDLVSSVTVGGVWMLGSPAGAFSIAGILMMSAVVVLVNVKEQSHWSEPD